MNTSLIERCRTEERHLQDIAAKTVEIARSCGADECEVSVGGARGLDVSSRGGELENIEFNRDKAMDITVFKGKRRGSASTTDLSEESLTESVKAALSIASFTDEDPCAGLCDPDLQCTKFKELALLDDALDDPDAAASYAVALERLVLENKPEGIKDSDGSEVQSTVYSGALANSQGFCAARSASLVHASLKLLGQDEQKMQHGYGFSLARSPQGLLPPEEIAREAVDRTLGKLNARPVKSGRYQVIFSRNAVNSLWHNFIGAISGGAQYRKTSFLCGKLGERVLPEYVGIFEDPLRPGDWGSANYDGEGVGVRPLDIVKDGVLAEYLLATYSARKLKLRSNGHCGGIYNWFVNFDREHTRSFDELLSEVGEGLVITELMGQGVDLASGTYSRGAAGYYFKNGQREHAVEEITVAGNLKDMLGTLALTASDIDERYKIRSGSVLLPDLAVSGL
ncbi:MAG: metalloprotease PmbA [Succinivibrio sp.]|nr:metalloprotease PmbA [Succinivibrio sp.]